MDCTLASFESNAAAPSGRQQVFGHASLSVLSASLAWCSAGLFGGPKESAKFCGGEEKPEKRDQTGENYGTGFSACPDVDKSRGQGVMGQY